MIHGQGSTSAGPRNRSAVPIGRKFQSLSLGERLGVRHDILDSIRTFFRCRGYVEVETPILCESPGTDPYIDAVKVEAGLYLCPSPEMHMKRLVSEGLEKIFQITKAFRAGEKGHLHNIEFTILEWYAAGCDYTDLMEETEALVVAAAGVLVEKNLTTAAGGWPRPFARVTVDEAFRKSAGWTPSEDFDAGRFFLDLVEKVEGPLSGAGAVFLHDYPRPLASLAKLREDEPLLAERFELYLNGIEICNGFTELTDPVEQERRFRRDNDMRRAMGKEAYPIDKRFLDALKKGMPPCAGNALGVDRLLMALAGADHIEEVTAFCHSRA